VTEMRTACSSGDSGCGLSLECQLRLPAEISRMPVLTDAPGA
jgi:hypothetical protein